jgi:hypothetical protein
VKPWVTALNRTLAFPSAVRGPVDFAAFLRFASNLRCEIMLLLRGAL